MNVSGGLFWRKGISRRGGGRERALKGEENQSTLFEKGEMRERKEIYNRGGELVRSTLYACMELSQ
jgi:hypothetical protein